MGAGFGPAGFGPAGFPYPEVGSAARNVTPPWAPYLDGATRDIPVDDNGQYAGVHPVDHEVEMQLINELGSFPVAPDIGHTFRQIAIDADEKMTPDAERRVRRALADLLLAGDVVDLEVFATSPSNSRAFITVKYRNARLRPEDGVEPQPRVLIFG